MTLDELANLVLTGARFTFTRALDEVFSRQFRATMVLATFRPLDPIQQVRAVIGGAVAKGTDVIWTVPQTTLARLREVTSQMPGLLVVELDAGLVRDAGGNQVSGSVARLLGGSPPYPPGGIFRSWMART